MWISSSRSTQHLSCKKGWEDFFKALLVKKSRRDVGVLSCNYIDVMDFIGAIRPCGGSHFPKLQRTPRVWSLSALHMLLFIEGAAVVDDGMSWKRRLWQLRSAGFPTH